MSAPDNLLLSSEAVQAGLAELDGWTVVDDGGTRLRKAFSFADFPEAMAFMTRVAFSAERLNHHPNWSNVYNRVGVEIWAHDLGGVSKLCLDLARDMDAAAS